VTEVLNEVFLYTALLLIQCFGSAGRSVVNPSLSYRLTNVICALAFIYLISHISFYVYTKIRLGISYYKRSQHEKRLKQMQ